jgi:hypothetical protein
MNEKNKSKWYWRLLRWGLIGLAVLVTLVAVLVTEEDWRGKHDWEACRHAAEARGERFDVASVIPPVVPDDQNFFCAPIVAETLESERNMEPSEQRATNAVNRLNFDIYRRQYIDSITENDITWQRGKLTDSNLLKQWQTAFRTFSATPEGKTNGFPVAAQSQTPAADVLLALSIFNPALEELRQASLRPYARIPLHYENGFDSVGELLPWLANMKRSAHFLQLRMLAELQNNQGDQALADLELLLRLNDSVRQQPFLISQLVRIAILQYLLQPFYEGLAQHDWSDAQLLDLEQALAKEDFLADYQFVLNGEKLFAIEKFERQRITRQMRSVEDNSDIIVTNSLVWWPDAMFYQNELCFAQLDESMSAIIEKENRLVAPTALSEFLANVQVQRQHYSPYKVLALAMAPAVASSVKKFAFAQFDVDVARVACALERYRLAHGEYPATLDALAPQFIEKVPHDIIGGQPLHYRLADDGRFVLYSVGWNAKDDGGTVALTKNGSVDRDNGDWVWQYPANVRQ